MNPMDYVKEMEQIKLCAARDVWKKQNENLPQPNDHLTWCKWWEKMFKDSYARYTKEMIIKKMENSK